MFPCLTKVASKLPGQGHWEETETRGTGSHFSGRRVSAERRTRKGAQPREGDREKAGRRGPARNPGCSGGTWARRPLERREGSPPLLRNRGGGTARRGPEPAAASHPSRRAARASPSPALRGPRAPHRREARCPLCTPPGRPEERPFPSCCSLQPLEIPVFLACVEVYSVAGTVLNASHMLRTTISGKKTKVREFEQHTHGHSCKQESYHSMAGIFCFLILCFLSGRGEDALGGNMDVKEV
ncbi:uncharacterized protein [Saccopteryx bilineata]|uniref:uncharacterized protein n=1 Tax=Saccopteryx bilineata TaxID=59482 RepID=UPI00338D93CA